MGSTLGIVLILGVVGSGIVFGLRHHREINSLRPPKDHWRQGHKLRFDSGQPARRLSRRDVRSYGLMTDEDYDDLDSAFSEGSRKSDYD